MRKRKDDSVNRRDFLKAAAAGTAAAAALAANPVAAHAASLRLTRRMAMRRHQRWPSRLWRTRRLTWTL